MPVVGEGTVASKQSSLQMELTISEQTSEADRNLGCEWKCGLVEILLEWEWEGFGVLKKRLRRFSRYQIWGFMYQDKNLSFRSHSGYGKNSFRKMRLRQGGPGSHCIVQSHVMKTRPKEAFVVVQGRHWLGKQIKR